MEPGRASPPSELLRTASRGQCPALPKQPPRPELPRPGSSTAAAATYDILMHLDTPPPRPSPGDGRHGGGRVEEGKGRIGSGCVHASGSPQTCTCRHVHCGCTHIIWEALIVVTW